MAIAFSNVLNPLEGLVKLAINIFSEEGNKDPTNSYAVMYNPASFEQNFQPVYETVKPAGAQETQQFKYIVSDTLNIELLFDATGASVSDGAKGSGVEDLSKKVVEDKTTYKAIFDFLNELYSVGSDTHKPKYVQIIWGNLDFSGVLASSKVTHSLFNSDGQPIRSKVNCLFNRHTPLSKQAAQAKKNSPDLTRFKQVKEEDNLPLIAQDTYKDPGLYLELARVNRINNFRSLRNGSRLRLPPVEK